MVFIEALRIEKIDYDVIKDKKSQSSVAETRDAITAIECAVHCSTKHGCFAANFRSPICEILTEASGSEFDLVDEWRWRYLCK